MKGSMKMGGEARTIRGDELGLFDAVGGRIMVDRKAHLVSNAE